VIVIESSPQTGDSPFSFGRAALIRHPRSNCTNFLRGLAKILGHAAALPRPPLLDRLPAALAVLGTQQSRSAAGPIAGSFISDPPGHWTAMKLFLADGEGEVFLNINAKDGVGEFSIKDEEYADIVIAELAKVLPPR
jgi:hypothetical protein